MTNLKSLPKILRSIRKFNKMTLTEMYKRTSTSNGHLSDIERGKKRITLNILDMYSKLFGVSTASMLMIAENFNIENYDNAMKAVNKCRPKGDRLSKDFINYLLSEI